MSWLEALISGLVQGLTEFLPVSSSGHLTILGTLFGMNGEENLAFAVIVHIATVLSTIVVLRREIGELLSGLLSFGWNKDTKTIIKLLISMIPVGIVGVFFKDTIEGFFGSGLALVGWMLLLTAFLLMISYYSNPRQKTEISFWDALLIGIAQACAVMPGLSRSGATIATGIMLGNKKESVAKFSFLMVIIPVLGEALLDTVKAFGTSSGDSVSVFSTLPVPVAVIGFFSAFITGVFACKWMIALVKKGRLVFFAYYCIAIGLFALIYSYLTN